MSTIPLIFSLIYSPTTSKLERVVLKRFIAMHSDFRTVIDTVIAKSKQCIIIILMSHFINIKTKWKSDKLVLFKMLRIKRWTAIFLCILLDRKLLSTSGWTCAFVPQTMFFYIQVKLCWNWFFIFQPFFFIMLGWKKTFKWWHSEMGLFFVTYLYNVYYETTDSLTLQ